MEQNKGSETCPKTYKNILYNNDNISSGEIWITQLFLLRQLAHHLVKKKMEFLPHTMDYILSRQNKDQIYNKQIIKVLE